MTPLYVKLTPQRHTADCVVACLSMLLGTSYEATLIAISKIRPDSGTEGLTWADAKKAGASLGFKLRIKNKADYANVVGILDCHPADPTMRHHAVFLLRGVVIDPEESTIWDDWEVYLEAHDMVGGSVLVRVD